MSFRRYNFGARAGSINRQQSRPSAENSNPELVTTKNDVVPNVLPDLTKIVRRLLPHELPFHMNVHDVEYKENGYENLIGTLYMTTFRLIFALDKQTDNNRLISSGNKYIGEFDIPLASIHKIDVAPVDTRSGFKSFLNDNQIQSEKRTFTIITRDFRLVKFSKCLVTNSNTTNKGNHLDESGTKMETYIATLRLQSQFRNHEQLYFHLALKQNSLDSLSPRANRNPTKHSHSIDDDIADYCLSNDERIKSYMTADDWREELCEANEERWSVDRKKFNAEKIIKDEGPYVRLKNSNEYDGYGDLIWHWTHTSQFNTAHQNRRLSQASKYMLITVLDIGDTSNPVEPVESPMSIPNIPSSSPFSFLNLKKKLPKPFRSNPNEGLKLIDTNENKPITTMDPMLNAPLTPDVGLRRAATDTSLMASSHYICEQPFQRYNLAKFPCQFKRLQASYEKLIEICVTTLDDADEKWCSKLQTCKWFKYISKALHGAASLAKLLNFKNIELAGSDTDNNCLMSSLIQIFVRPKCRTIKGFCELIVREWIIRGHKFRERFGQVQVDINGHSVLEAPIFLLFLDCVHQLILQNPFSFEFTEYLLLELYRNLCYCYQHTFAFNNILERMEAIQHSPKNLLVLSSFDFSLYLCPETFRLLRNEACVFNTQRYVISRPPIRPRNETAVISSSAELPARTNRTVYHLERPKSPNFRLDLPLTNGMNTVNSEQFEYDLIESPQIFAQDLHVDWRTFNLALWSKCYCRYDQINYPSSQEQTLADEIHSLTEDLEKLRSKSKRTITLDTYHYIGYANSWHPQALNTRV